MSKEEILKIQVCVLKVNIHCDGCKDKVKKILQKIDGVFTTKIDAEAGKVTVSGNVDPSLLIKKLGKAGKRAELWGSRKPNGNNNNNIHNQMPNQFKNMNVNAKGGNDKGQKPNGNNNVNQVKGGNNPQQNQLQMKLQQIKELQSMMPQLKDQKMGPGHPNQKAVKFVDEDDDEYSDDEYDGEYSDEFDEDDDEFDDEDYEIDQPHHPTNKMIMNGLNPQFMNNAQKGAPNGKQGVPGGGGKNGNGGQKGGGGGGNFNGNGGGKNNGGKPQNGQNGGGGNKTVGGGGGGKDNNIPILMNGVQKGNNGGGAMNGGLGNMVGPGGAGQFGNMKIPVGQINNMSMSQLSNIPAVQGLPAASSGGPSGGNGYYPGSGPDMMAGNPINQQQQYLAMMNQQRAMGGNERFQPMMYARPPPAVNYVPPPYPYPYPSPYPPHYGYGSDPYSDAFSDENTSSSCNIM